MDATSLEHAWREYVARQGYPKDGWTPEILESSRQSWLAGYAAGAGYALSAIKAVAKRKDGEPYGPAF